LWNYCKRSRKCSGNLCVQEVYVYIGQSKPYFSRGVAHNAKVCAGREINTCVISHVLKELNNHQLCKPHVRPAWRKLNVMGCCPTSRSTKFVPMSSCVKRSTTCCLPRSTECTLRRQTKNCQRAKVPREQNKLPITFCRLAMGGLFSTEVCSEN
jgi:hypothetical protein